MAAFETEAQKAHKCPKFKANARFAKSLGLSEDTFNPENDICYCMEFCSKRHPNKVTRGTKAYGLPLGWSALALSIDEKEFERRGIFRDWHVSFHGTKKDTAVAILKDEWLLLLPGDVTSSGFEIPIRGGHIPRTFKRTNKFTKTEEMFDPNQVFTSPSINYCAYRGVYCDRTQFEGREYEVAFQLRQKPDTYAVGQETVGASERHEVIDERFSNDELEYYSNRKGVHKIYRLLIREAPHTQKAGRRGGDSGGGGGGGGGGGDSGGAAPSTGVTPSLSVPIGGGGLGGGGSGRRAAAASSAFAADPLAHPEAKEAAAAEAEAAVAKKAAAAEAAAAAKKAAAVELQAAAKKAAAQAEAAALAHKRNSPQGKALGKKLVELCETYRKVDVAKELVDKGASLEEKDSCGDTALMIAAYWGRAEVASLLLGAGAGTEHKDKSGSTALMNAAYGGHAEVASLLLGAGAGTEHKNEDGYTALMIAARFDRVEVASLLLGAGAGMEHKNEDGYTARDLAIKWKHKQWWEVVKLLDEHAGGRAPGTLEMD